VLATVVPCAFLTSTVLSTTLVWRDERKSTSAKFLCYEISFCTVKNVWSMDSWRV